jgi:putative ABC transport system permease protein
MSLWDWLFRRRQREEELDEEVQAHLRMAAQERMEQGETAEQARASAVREFGNVTLVEEVTRDMWGFRWLGTLLQDLRYGLRQLRRNPGFTAVAVLSLALGIGANTAIFSVVSAVLLRPLPFPDPGRLVRVVSTRLGETAADNASYPDFADWRAENHVFSRMASFNVDSFTLTGAGEAAHVQGAVVSAELFPLLGVKPLLGRTFLPDEDKLSATTAGFPIILSHRLWRERFSSERGIVGRTITLDDRAFIVVGVMPAGFQYPIQAEPLDFWTTVAVEFLTAPGQPSMAEQRGAHYLDVIARLRPGVSRAQAQAEMSTIVKGLNQQYPENAPRAVRIIPELDGLVGGVRPALIILLTAVGCVLLIACANVANLLLARGTGRQKEIAIRGALGAGRARMIRQLLTESVVLALLGGSLGIGLAYWGIPALLRLVPEEIPRLADVRLDGSVLLFTALLSLLTGILFGLVPALQISQSDYAESLKESARGLSEGLHHSRVRSILVVADVAVAAILLVGAGLLIQSFWRLERIDPGFNPHNVLAFKIDLPYVRYSGVRQTEFFREAVERLNHLPGVRSASAALPLPLDGNEVGTGFDIEGRSVPEPERPRTNYSWTEPGYFRTLGIPFLQGRDFTAADDLKATPVVIINQTLAKQFFPDQRPIGRRIRPGIGNGYSAPPMREIVGVVGDLKRESLTSEPSPEVYVPNAQSPLGSMIFVVRTEVDPASLVGTVRKEIAAMDKDLPISGVRTLDQSVARSIAQPHFLTVLLGAFAALALTLAAVGLYGVVSYSVARRTHEIGVRLALGAERTDVVRLVVGQGIRLTLIGVTLGILAAMGLTQFLATVLYGVKPTDLVTLTAVALLLAIVALLASYIPARRAMKVDPMVALRYE